MKHGEGIMTRELPTLLVSMRDALSMFEFCKSQETGNRRRSRALAKSEIKDLQRLTSMSRLLKREIFLQLIDIFHLPLDTSTI